MSCVHGGRPIGTDPELTPCPSLDTHPLAQATPLARILLSDATDKVCAEQFTLRGHDVDSKPGLSKEELKKIIHEYDGASGFAWLGGNSVGRPRPTAAHNTQMPAPVRGLS